MKSGNVFRKRKQKSCVWTAKSSPWSMVVEELWPTLLYNVASIHCRLALLRSHCSVSLRSGLLQRLNSFFFFEPSCQLQWLESLFWCIKTQFGPSIRCWTGGLTFDFRVYREIHGWLRDYKVPKPSDNHLTAGKKSLCWCLWFLPNMMLCIMGKDLYFGFICPKAFVPEVLGFNLTNKTYLFKLQLIVWWWTLTFGLLTEAWRI